MGVFCSFVYVNLIYALALTFKHIGKALGVVLVILQIPGSAGTYPIEMTPAFFQRLHPLLPFTYGISAMRECMKTLMEDDEWKQEFLVKSEKFEKRYPKMIRWGFLGMIIIPLVFLILMFSLESKLVFLILWIVSLIGLAVYLIVVEYLHDKMQRQLAMTGMTTEDLIHEIKEERGE